MKYYNSCTFTSAAVISLSGQGKGVRGVFLPNIMSFWLSDEIPQLIHTHVTEN